jgi:hypothetical protein
MGDENAPRITVLASPENKVWSAIEAYLTSGIAFDYPNPINKESISTIIQRVESEQALAAVLKVPNQGISGRTQWNAGFPFFTPTTNLNKITEVMAVMPDGMEVLTWQALGKIYPELLEAGNHIHESDELEGTHSAIIAEKLRVIVEDLQQNPEKFKQCFPKGLGVFVMDLGFTANFLTPTRSHADLNGWQILEKMGICCISDKDVHNTSIVAVGDGFDPDITPFPGIYVGPVMKALKAYYHKENFAEAWEAFLNDPRVLSELQALYEQKRSEIGEEKTQKEVFSATQTGALASAFLYYENGAVKRVHETSLDVLVTSTPHQHHYVPSNLRGEDGQILLPSGTHAMSAFLYDGDHSHLDSTQPSITQQHVAAMLERWGYYCQTHPELRSVTTEEGLRAQARGRAAAD